MYSTITNLAKKSYEEMLLLRKFQEKCAQIYLTGKIGGFCHLYIGQEAVAVGVYNAIKKSDYVVTTYRCHVQAILSGIPPKEVLAELMGKSSGCSKGKGGSMHLFNPKGNFYGGHGIVGGSVPLGTGIALTQKYNKTKNICVTFLGDGATNQGQVFEAFNMASLWKLPILYIIENNQYSMGTSVERSTVVTDLYKKGEGFGIKGYQIEGMDILKIYEMITKLSDQVRQTSEPVLLEIKTYRYKGHSMSDPGKYRTREEVDQYRKNDPIENILSYITSKNILNTSDIDLIKKKVKNIVKDSVEFAESSSIPAPEELNTDIYIKNNN